jgi:DNA repair protein RecN (Recombination protein N)
VIQEGIEHLARELADLGARVDLDPEELAAIETRMGDIFTLKRRYGPSLEELFINRDRAAEELASYNDAAAAAAEFTARIECRRKELRALCD